MQETRSSAYGNYHKCVIARINSHIKPVEWYNKSVCSRTRIPTGVCVRACAEQRRVGQRDLTSKAPVITTHTRTQSSLNACRDFLHQLPFPPFFFFQASAETSPRGWGGDEGCRGEERSRNGCWLHRQGPMMIAELRRANRYYRSDEDHNKNLEIKTISVCVSGCRIPIFKFEIFRINIRYKTNKQTKTQHIICDKCGSGVCDEEKEKRHFI